MPEEPVSRFDFHRDGNAYRRDRDAVPRVIVVGIDSRAYRLQYHIAGDEYVRAIDLRELENAMIEDMAPRDAFLVGAWCERAVQTA